MRSHTLLRGPSRHYQYQLSSLIKRQQTAPKLQRSRMSAATSGKGSLPHQMRTAAEPRQNRLYNVRLSHIEQVNPCVRLLQLTIPPEVQNPDDSSYQESDQESQPPPQPLTFLPGQWLDVHIPSISNAGGFSITSTPADAQVLPSLANQDSDAVQAIVNNDATGLPPLNPDGRPPYVELAVRAAPSNPASAWLWKPAEEILGSELAIRVGGSFVWPPSGVRLGDVRNVVFIAGGVGINPLISMLSHLNNDDEATTTLRHPSLNIRFLYSTKLPQPDKATTPTTNPEKRLDQILFLSRLREIVNIQSQLRRLRIALDLFITDLDDDTRGVSFDDLRIHGRRINADDLRAAAISEDGTIEPEKTVCYVCGPPGMTDDIVGKLEGLLGGGERVFYEKWW
ncbi:FAD-dependent oxidoreductase [Aspergillus saccharolyticus JOP 1030-1]|uniref:FAD-binding FR-type domain-containing protein n=1 Tax=Aspergillus saccharolyticus JOP 1030-1 TaxID=1450539 RepID=A0A318ZK25_9EURO|nr:hypothetical protein BP01DRAFT_355118 [Aspergillus saccharolyticus JOP 1030-1]PYH46724.1 hypothetical protein BP01DRAFT_355118 [Aspergillus saccharolyticus JOP 1030-1]